MSPHVKGDWKGDDVVASLKQTRFFTVDSPVPEHLVEAIAARKPDGHYLLETADTAERRLRVGAGS